MEEKMPNAQEFCLRWNNFHSSLVSALDGFKNDEDFVDVTLACEGQFLKAHKMLLSACSVFFRDLLKANPCQHPIVILPPEVKFNDLEKLLRFIYQGEVNVQQENLARFLKTAEMLKIRGLAEDNDKMLRSSPRPPDTGDPPNGSPKRPRLSTEIMSAGPQTPHSHNDDSRLSGGDSDSEMIPVKQEMVVEFKDNDAMYEGGETEPFSAEAYLREGGTTTSSSQPHPPPPPPPGPLIPSYVPPPQVKSQDDSLQGSHVQDEITQATITTTTTSTITTSSSSSSLLHRHHPGHHHHRQDHHHHHHSSLNLLAVSHPDSAVAMTAASVSAGLGSSSLCHLQPQPSAPPHVEWTAENGTTHHILHVSSKRWRCKRCQMIGHEKRTKTWCQECGVALCITCIPVYHDFLNLSALEEEGTNGDQMNELLEHRMDISKGSSGRGASLNVGMV